MYPFKIGAPDMTKPPKTTSTERMRKHRETLERLGLTTVTFQVRKDQREALERLAAFNKLSLPAMLTHGLGPIIDEWIERNKDKITGGSNGE
jgi:hypothetical protein